MKNLYLKSTENPSVNFLGLNSFIGFADANKFLFKHFMRKHQTTTQIGQSEKLYEYRGGGNTRIEYVTYFFLFGNVTAVTHYLIYYFDTRMHHHNIIRLNITTKSNPVLDALRTQNDITYLLLRAKFF